MDSDESVGFTSEEVARLALLAVDFKDSWSFTGDEMYEARLRVGALSATLHVVAGFDATVVIEHVEALDRMIARCALSVPWRDDMELLCRAKDLIEPMVIPEVEVGAGWISGPAAFLFGT